MLENERKSNEGELDKALRYEITDGSNAKQFNMHDQRGFLNDSFYLHAKVPPLEIVLDGSLHKN